MAATIIGGVLASGTTVTTAVSTSILDLMTVTKVKVGIASAVAVTGLSIPIVWQQQSLGRLRAENRALLQANQHMAEQAARGAAANGLSTPPAQATRFDEDEIERLRRDAREVHKLRNEIGGTKEAEGKLRKQLALIMRQASAARMNGPEITNDCRFFPEPHEYTPEERAVQLKLIERTRQLAVWWQAFLGYAGEHDGVLPAHWRQATPYLPVDFQSTLHMDSSYPTRNNPMKLENIENWSRQVIFRDSGVELPDGRVTQIYFFANGHSALFNKPEKEPGSERFMDTPPGVDPITGEPL